jgi:biotin carboxylase
VAIPAAIPQPVTAAARVLLLLPAASYRNDAFLAAAARLKVEVIAAADYCHRLAPLWGLQPIMAVPFDRPHAGLEKIEQVLDHPPDAVLAVDDHGIELAALLNQSFGLPGNSPAAVAQARDKLGFRELLAAAGLEHPRFACVPDHAAADTLPPGLRFPVVVKARRLNASRGVIRADDPAQYRAAVARVRDIQRFADRDAARLGLVVEAFIPGTEYALEGLLEDGRLSVLALFDKPDPLDGPYFEETIYTTPSRLAEDVQQAVAMTVGHACRAAGLVTGPVHAEMRVNAAGIFLLEIAPRSIGGLCGRVIEYALGINLEELVLRQALRRPLPPRRPAMAAAVMMIPIPARGIFNGVRGVAAARAVAGIDDVSITAETGQIVTPPPEGATYLGFIFARAPNPEAAVDALRQAHHYLTFDIRPVMAASR